MATIFLHPMGLDGQVWQWTGLEGLKPDLRGHGRTPLGDATLTIESVADELLKLAEPPLDVIGVSLGGTLAVRMALRAPDRIRSLVVACSGVLDTPERQARLRERAEASERAGMPGVLDSTLQRWFTAAALSAPDHRGVAYARRRLLADDARAFAAWWRAMAAHTVRSEIGAIRAPVTVLAGRDDAASSVASVLEVFDALRGPRRMEIVPGPHMLPLECPDVFSEAVRLHFRWVEQQGGRAAR